MLEVRSLDTSQILLEAIELGEMVNQSREVAQYLYWKEQMSGDPEAKEKVKNFQRQKEFFEECERFGHFHPDYHDALGKVRIAEQELEQVESVRNFKQAEDELDNLLYTLAEIIAKSVSEDIKVPSNDPFPKDSGCGNCGSGGSCSGNCG